MEYFLSYEGLTALLTLTLMEIILGIDNIIFIAILVEKIPQLDLRRKIRSLGITLALLIRIALLFSISWVMSLTETLFTISGKDFSGRDLILLFGGLFLLGKSTMEIHHKLEDKVTDNTLMHNKGTKNAASMLLQILLLDIVFSLDSVITAVGMVSQISIMITAMLLSMLVMLFSAQGISSFVEKHPTIKVLALSFLMMIGVMLIGESLGTHINKGYIYFAMFFSFCVEMINIRLRKKH